MVTQEHIESLQKLQKVDIEIRQLLADLRRYPGEIRDLRQHLVEKEESVRFKESRLGELKTERSTLEASLERNNESVKNSEARLFSIKTHREYEALQKEITETKKQNLEIEGNILSLMEEIEETEKQLHKEREDYLATEELYVKEIEEKEKKIEQLETSRRPAEQEKNELVSKIDPKILPIYERVFERNGEALALAENEKCTSCNINIPPQLFNEILKRIKLIQCPSCKKILYTES